LRQGSYRGLAATANHFARESHIDELAHLVEMDPLEFRLKNLKDERMRDVLNAAAKAFGWDRTPKLDHGFGICCGFEKNGYVACCVEVAAEWQLAKSPTKERAKSSAKDARQNANKDKTTEEVSFKILRVVEAFDCGAVVNPLHLKNQIEGAVVQAIGGAMFEALQFANGQILNPKFSLYRVPRFSDTPPIEVVLVDRKDVPSAGAGETPIVGLAPAVANAIFNAAHMRLRSLPLAPKG
jgi:isoquinoline 1-oxidoreductase